MSRHITEISKGEYKTTVADINKCKYMYDDVCCNDSSIWLADYPSNNDCKQCTHFEKEDLND